ncbi:acetate--CoA ligase [Salirhabdus salicampi]|uniref:acetate--CoA ligase n=1 Tax=Salirhabdus salicampi TaxID=476102 RepID=UPI0020C333D6|nr:acetate--CoA ligase [Salirhabdus salicampi]MCP8615931.1 acetate--CoA ligase [Salirhabdus salicampi]
MTVTSGIVKPYESNYNLQHYEKVYNNFSWESVEKAFSWSKTGQLNIAYEAVDKHVDEGYGDKIALHYVHNETEVKLTFADLKQQSDQYAQVLRKHGVKKGDRVFIFLPKHPDCYVAIMAVIKIGAIAGPLFEAFMEEAIKDRMQDCGAKVLITNSELVSRVPREELPDLQTVLITGESSECQQDELSLWEEIRGLDAESDENVIEWVERDDPMIIHYTSGSTGKPKGILHAHRAMIQQYQTGKWVLDLKEDDVYWCTAHPGWVTGSSYGVFAPWLNRATIIVNGGRFAAEAWYELIERTRISVWYSAPTAFRMLMSAGEELQKQYDLSSLRHILSVGEPLNPEVITWGKRTLQLRIHDTWWMTETGAQLIVNLPSQPIKPGSMGRPLPGIKVEILNDKGEPLPIGEVGQLAIKANWPSIMKGIWKNEEKHQSYFPYDGWYISGDLAYKDEDGYIFFQGRNDDMINSSGERIGPFEVESKLIEHPAVAEAGVIGKPNELRGEIVKAFIVLRNGYQPSDELLKDVRAFVKTKLAAHAAPREIEVLEQLPKTRISGKIMRRVLKAWDLGIDPGDTSALDGGQKKETLYTTKQ